jgi:hypothetical protein
MLSLSIFLVIVALWSQVCVQGADVFPYTSGTLSNTSDATQNTVLVQQEACRGDKLHFTTCSKNIEHTFITRLYHEAVQVAYTNFSFPMACDDDTDDDECLCSTLDYTYPASGPSCSTLILKLGCLKDTDCSMTAKVDISNMPTKEDVDTRAYSFRLSNTSGATQNTAKKQVEACPGDRLLVTTCSFDHIIMASVIRLYHEGLQVTKTHQNP